MQLTFLGGAGEVGASCILVRIKDKNILLDCGIRQGSTKDPLPDFRSIQDQGGLDAVIISHAHMDHTGALPMISKEYPQARIYMNNMTKDIVKVLLYDSLKIMNNREGEIPLYAAEDVERMLDRIFTINYQREFEIFEGIKISFYIAGHVAGASCIYITCEEGSLFYSGDFSIFPQNSIEGAKIPKLRPDVAIFESTYGDKLHSNREVEESKLIKLVEECASKGGKMIIPAFALGRAQEILLILKKAINKGRLKKINIYADGMVKDINRVYKQNPLFLKSSLGKKILKGNEPFYDDNVKPVESREQRDEILNEKDCTVIVSSSGMLTGGPSAQYAEKIAAMENGYIVITGYQDEESPGRKLLNLIETEEKDRILDINDKSIPVKCRVERVGLSAHGDKSEIKALLALLSPKNVFLVHGEEGIISSLAEELALEARHRIYVPRVGETVDIEVRSPRKQFKKQYPYILNNTGELTENTIESFWRFVYENYGDRLFTVEELLIIWRGSLNFSSDEIEKLQKLLFKTSYFENDLRRFFMFRALGIKEVEEKLKDKELKQNEVTNLISEYFADYNFKKAGLKQEEKKVVLTFDFPKVVSKNIKQNIQAFEENTGWKVEISDSTNHNAAESLLRSLLREVKIKKLSYFLNEGRYVVTIEEEDMGFENEKEKFKESTGFELIIKGTNTVLETKAESIVYRSEAKKVMEQNQALDFIDKSFSLETFKPYKKSVKPDRLIELFFISPVVGFRYENKIKDIGRTIGWNMRISSSVNQNEIISLASRLCMEEGVEMKKNPSFNPANNKVTLRLEESSKDESKLKEIKEEFEYKTGCQLDWT